MPTREFEFLKSIIAPFGQVVVAAVAAAWLAPHWVTISASGGLFLILAAILRRMYLLIRLEEARHGAA